LCPPVPRRVRSSDQGTEPLLGQAGPKCVHNPIVRSLLADGRTQRRKPPKKGSPLRNSTSLVYPMAFCELSRREPRTLGVSLHKVQSKFRENCENWGQWISSCFLCKSTLTPFLKSIHRTDAPTIVTVAAVEVDVAFAANSCATTRSLSRVFSKCSLRSAGTSDP